MPAFNNIYIVRKWKSVMTLAKLRASWRRLNRQNARNRAVTKVLSSERSIAAGGVNNSQIDKR